MTAPRAQRVAGVEADQGLRWPSRPGVEWTAEPVPRTVQQTLQRHSSCMERRQCMRNTRHAIGFKIKGHVAVSSPDNSSRVSKLRSGTTAPPNAA